MSVSRADTLYSLICDIVDYLPVEDSVVNKLYEYTQELYEIAEQALRVKVGAFQEEK